MKPIVFLTLASLAAFGWCQSAPAAQPNKPAASAQTTVKRSFKAQYLVIAGATSEKERELCKELVKLDTLEKLKAKAEVGDYHVEVTEKNVFVFPASQYQSEYFKQLHLYSEFSGSPLGTQWKLNQLPAPTQKMLKEFFAGNPGRTGSAKDYLNSTPDLKLFTDARIEVDVTLDGKKYHASLTPGVSEKQRKKRMDEYHDSRKSAPATDTPLASANSDQKALKQEQEETAGTTLYFSRVLRKAKSVEASKAYYDALNEAIEQQKKASEAVEIACLQKVQQQISDALNVPSDGLQDDHPVKFSDLDPKLQDEILKTLGPVTETTLENGLVLKTAGMLGSGQALTLENAKAFRQQMMQMKPALANAQVTFNTHLVLQAVLPSNNSRSPIDDTFGWELSGIAKD